MALQVFYKSHKALWCFAFFWNFLGPTWPTLFPTGVQTFHSEQCREVGETKKQPWQQPGARTELCDLTWHQQSPHSPLSPSRSQSHHLHSFTFHFSLWNLHQSLCDWLKWTEDKSEKDPMRIQAPCSPTFSRLPSSHSNFITVYQQNRQSPSKQIGSCAKDPVTPSSFV